MNNDETRIAMKRDLVLAPGQYAYMQDVTKGILKTYTGPTVINPTAQEVPVAYHPDDGTFKRTATLEEAVRKSAIAVEGYYLVLKNPARKDERPSEGSQSNAPDLDVGRKINIPGPTMFALWPGQAAEMIRGHHLRSNQYLLVRVYNEDEARKNWTKAIVKPATPSDGSPPEPVATAKAPADLTVGKLLIIKGTEVSFYIPPTGIGVVIGDDGQYVREALTLERLEYCILVDENGNKRYERGPQVTFPAPTEQFVMKKSDRKFRALELNEIQGLHLKVIAPYTEDGKSYKVGDELFITGKETSIYFPREEHSLVSYDGKSKHFATAVPAGEARYVMDRMSGEIAMKRGPAMLLPDPRKEVIVRRVLSDKQAQLWYPGNIEALMYNQSLRALLANSPSTRSGAVSEGDVMRGGLQASGNVMYNSEISAEMKTAGGAKPGAVGTRSAMSKSAAAHAGHMADHSNVSSNAKLDGVDEFSRASTYNAPRSITIDTKYEGCPAIQLWTGYAIMVVSKTGKRRVEQGPKTVLLDYDESLEVIGLSTGKPKTTNQIYQTVYLRTLNNKVADIVEAETSDHVGVTVKISLRVNFTGEPMKWFDVENYVKFLCDHVRSVIKGGVRKVTVEQFHADSTGIVRDLVLGKPDEKNVRPGMLFEENGMHVDDVEVLEAKISDATVAQLVNAAQLDVVKTNIQIGQARRQLETVKTTEQIEREKAEALTLTEKRKHQLSAEQTASRLALVLAQLKADLEEKAKQREVEQAKQETLDLNHDAQRERNKLDADQTLAIDSERQALRLTALKAEAEAVVTRFAAAQTGFSEALLALSNNETLVKVAEAWNIQRAIGGDSLADALKQVFEGTPLGSVIGKIVAPVNGSTSKPNAQV